MHFLSEPSARKDRAYRSTLIFSISSTSELTPTLKKEFRAKYCVYCEEGERGDTNNNNSMNPEQQLDMALDDVVEQGQGQGQMDPKGPGEGKKRNQTKPRKGEETLP